PRVKRVAGEQQLVLSVARLAMGSKDWRSRTQSRREGRRLRNQNRERGRNDRSLSLHFPVESNHALEMVQHIAYTAASSGYIPGGVAVASCRRWVGSVLPCGEHSPTPCFSSSSLLRTRVSVQPRL